MAAYLVATMDVHDAEGYRTYQTEVPALIARHGGTYIVRGGERVALEGEWPGPRIVILEFPYYAAARAFADDPDYTTFIAVRQRTTTSRIFIVEGFEGAPPAAGFGAFLLASITVEDPETYKGYAVQVPDVITRLGGTFLVRGGKAEGLEGAPDPGRVVLAGFRDLAALQAFHGSADYAPLIELRHSASTGTVVGLEAYKG
ncbi:MAG: DUF1330 domain-containing protein [Alphaproteobacteria bacterium]